ncbi:MAG: hypothetical protein HC771_24205 [Synechococcales cyanobacterium CRU_2_2]|nr:hypothetical protein [Synechococcales cyanobacterium CRU_2_2]
MRIQFLHELPHGFLNPSRDLSSHFYFVTGVEFLYVDLNLIVFHEQLETKARQQTGSDALGAVHIGCHGHHRAFLECFQRGFAGLRHGENLSFVLNLETLLETLPATIPPQPGILKGMGGVVSCGLKSGRNLRRVVSLGHEPCLTQNSLLITQN